MYVPTRVPARALKKKATTIRVVAGIERQLYYKPFLMLGAGLKPTVRLALILITSPV